MNETAPKPDPRNFASGAILPNEGYCDQPYVVVSDDGTWVCVMTTGTGTEGAMGQHVVSMRSADGGRTWSNPVDVEPADGPEASWAMPLRTPDGRIFCFYTYNDRNLRSVKSDDGETSRVDTLGAFAFRVSIDDGRSWSAQRYTVPLRCFQIDRENPYGGDILFWWGVSKPIIHDGAAYVGFSKVGRFGEGFMARSEGAFVRSVNILTEHDPARIVWETLPDGEIGLRAPRGPIADEHNLVGLDDGSLYCTYRTIDGWNCAAYSRDGGHSWSEPAYATYTPDGRRMKHPRAANFVRKLTGGRYILWYHNNGTRWYNNGPAFGNRNVAWVAGGTERNGYIHWSEPEIVLYNDDFLRGSSYPDFVERPDGRLCIVSTQKTDARVNTVDPHLLAGLWSTDSRVPGESLRVDLDHERARAETTHTHGELPSLYGPWRPHEYTPPLGGRGGFSLQVRGGLGDAPAGTTIVENRDGAGRGFALSTTADAGVRLEICDGWARCSWDSDAGAITTGATDHLVVIVDGGPKVISFIVNGRLCDGGAHRPYGWGRFFAGMKDVTGSGRIRLGVDLDRLRLWTRALRTAEALECYRADA